MAFIVQNVSIVQRIVIIIGRGSGHEKLIKTAFFRNREKINEGSFGSSGLGPADPRLARPGRLRNARNNGAEK
jgi:hypothetical protein